MAISLKWLTSIALIALLLATGLMLIRGHIDHAQQMERDAYEKLASQMQESLEHRITSCTQAMVGLRAFASSDPEFTDEQFQTFAGNIMPNAPEIRCLQLAPGGVVTYLRPVEGNEAARGLDLLADSRESASARAAIELGKAVGAGPYDLRQGGLGLIFRLPIYDRESGSAETRDSASDGSVPEPRGMENFWGFAIAVIDFPPLLENSGVTEVTTAEFALRSHMAPEQAPGKVFHGDAAIFADAPVLARVALPTGSWQLALRPLGGWGGQTPSEIALHLLVFVTAGTIGLAAWWILKQNEQLKKQLAEIRTLQGILPICSSCKNVRDDEGYWVQVEAYVTSHTGAHFSHGICPDCMGEMYGDQEWYQANEKSG